MAKFASILLLLLVGLVSGVLVYFFVIKNYGGNQSSVGLILMGGNDGLEYSSVDFVTSKLYRDSVLFCSSNIKIVICVLNYSFSP